MNPAKISDNWKFQEMKHTYRCGMRWRTRISKGNQERDEEQEQIVMNVNGCRISKNSKVAEK